MLTHFLRSISNRHIDIYVVTAMRLDPETAVMHILTFMVISVPHVHHESRGREEKKIGTAYTFHWDFESVIFHQFV
jgi:hypothetical protein